MNVKNVTAALCLALIGGCPFASGAQNASTLTFSPYEFQARDGTRLAAERGEFFVPENRSVADSRRIKIGFVREAELATEIIEAVGPFADGLSMTNCISATVHDSRGEPLFDNQPRGIGGETRGGGSKPRAGTGEEATSGEVGSGHEAYCGTRGGRAKPGIQSNP